MSYFKFVYHCFSLKAWHNDIIKRKKLFSSIYWECEEAKWQLYVQILERNYVTCWTLFISWLGRVIYLMYGYIQRECYIGLNFWLLVALNDWTRKQSGFKTHAHAVIILKAFWCSIVVCRLPVCPKPVVTRML